MTIKEIELSQARRELQSASNDLQIMLGDIINLREELAEAESKWRAQRAKVTRMVENISRLEQS